MPAQVEDASVMTDRMTIYDGLLRQRHDTTLREFLASRWQDGAGKAWDDIALELRAALKDSPYEPPRQSVIDMAVRLGIYTDRPKGMARLRRRRTTS